MAAKLVRLASGLGFIAGALGDVYDDLKAFRTQKVVDSFDPAKAEGVWYEVAFNDIAQVGASCQHSTKSFDATTGAMSEAFTTKYGPLPFTIQLEFVPMPNGKGIYKKYTKGAEALLTLPTVIVDAVDGADGRYSLLTDYVIRPVVAGAEVHELRLLSRTPEVSTEVLAQMTSVAAQLGVDAKTVQGLKKTDLSKCGFGRVQGAEEEVLVLKPSSSTGKEAAVVMLVGMQIENTAYQPMLEKVQEAAASQGISLYAAVPKYFGNVPEPVDVKQRMSDAVAKLKQAGMQDSAPVFYAAHSLGTVFLQDFVNSEGSKAAGQILMGGFLLRKHFTPDLSFSVPTLTVGAELDGLARVTRITESFYHQKGHQDFPVVVLMGQNHMQFASGTPPANVKKNDLAAEVDEVTAHTSIGSVVADFMALRLGLSAAGAVVQAKVAETTDFLAPVISAYELEGSRRFNVPAQVGGPDAKQCVRGLCPSSSTWAPTAQQLISELEGYELDVSNAYVQLSGSPVTGQDFHLPKISPDGNTIHITTYSQCYWNDAIDEVLEDFDTGFTFTSAQEIGTKLASRQCTLNVGAGQKVDFSVDDPDFCAQANQKAYDWALQHAPAKTAQRFQAQGIPLVMGKDVQKSGGPFWLDARLSFNKTQQDGKTVVEVASPAQKTEQDYWEKHFHIPRPSAIPDPGCYHYCKLLSPARAMEWMLVDGLRASPAEELFI